MNPDHSEPAGLSRRAFVHACALGGANLAVNPSRLGWHLPTMRSSSVAVAGGRIPLDSDWRFGGRLHGQKELARAFSDAEFRRVTLPHCAVNLSWQRWRPEEWEHVWVYRRAFSLPRELQGYRMILHFDGIMVGAMPVVNGHALSKHLGGYLPFQYEVTGLLAPGVNQLALALDSRWSNVPPEGSPRGPASIDYLEPGGIVRPVSLHAVPRTFISDVFARPMRVLDADRYLDLTCTLDAGEVSDRALRLEARLLRDGRELARAAENVQIEKTGEKTVRLRLHRLGRIGLWSPDAPRLYELAVTLLDGGKPAHLYHTRIGFRDARFEADGFFLNGRRFRIFGLNRHELFPYVGFAMPRRVLRRDAEILRHEFNCNFVRCSHYPQSEDFIDACDELGLMVWEELPGWQYLGDATWKQRAVQDVGAMVRRDRNHPAVVIWGVRINESPNDPALYRRTKALAHALDGSRPTSGTMTRRSTRNWLQDVFAFDDYHAGLPGVVNIAPPLPGVPYLVTEAVGQFNYSTRRGFNSVYRRGGDRRLERQQALRHAQAHNNGAQYPRLAGVVAWCAFDYGSLINSYDGVKCPGIADVFRIPKLGAAFYRTQGEPRKKAVIEPDFYWDFARGLPLEPGEPAVIFSNCDRLEIYLDGRHYATARPDHAQFPHLAHPPFFVKFELEGFAKSDLRIDGYVAGQRIVSRSFAADPAGDRLRLFSDDSVLAADGADATRLVFYAADRFGALRPSTGGQVKLRLEGPGEIVGDNPFSLAGNGAGAVWIRAAARTTGTIRVTATHSWLGKRVARVQVVAPGAPGAHPAAHA